MSMSILGWVLIIIGVLALAFGIAGGIAAMFKDLRRKVTESKSFGPAMLPTEAIKALTEFLNALIKAPAWLALVFVGIFLIAWGATMIGKS